jgi:2-polyprenyl-3-methyl-5-hydroxy-6-metoxy-1,4-benzoquinol methylase
MTQRGTGQPDLFAMQNVAPVQECFTVSFPSVQRGAKHMADATSFFTDGAAYETLMGRWSRTAGEVFVDWLSPLQGLRWLDVGCGTRAFTELVIDRCRPKQISAIDPAEDQITYA